jgi:hypothetical protein
MALVAKRQNAGSVDMIVIDGPEATPEALRATAHRILVAKRVAAGQQPVDLKHLVEGGPRFHS